MLGVRLQVGQGQDFEPRARLVDVAVEEANEAGERCGARCIALEVTNNISSGTTAAHPVTAATVNECVGSATGGGGTVNCHPFPPSTTGATVTQCNGSGTGGGGTVHCTVDSASVVSPAIPVKVNQCNGTGNPGGSVVTCSVRIFTHITPAATSGGTTGTTPGSTITAKAKATTAGVAKANAAKAAAGASGDQVSRVPKGGVQTGGGSTSREHHDVLIWVGGVLIAAGAGAALWSRRAHGASGTSSDA